MTALFVTFFYCFNIYVFNKRNDWYHKTSLSHPVKIFLLTVPKRCFFCGSFLLFLFRVCRCHEFLSVHCSLLVTCWERADLLALLYVMFSCVFVTSPCGVLGQVWCLIVSIPDLYLHAYSC